MIDEHFDAERLQGLLQDRCIYTRPSGLLLCGPSGCGKTHLIRALMDSLPRRCFHLTCADLVNKEVGASEKLIQEVFEKASQGDGSGEGGVIFFDDLDLLLPAQRDDNQLSRLWTSLLSSLLLLIDRSHPLRLEDSHAASRQRCRGRCYCARGSGGVVVVATACSADTLNGALLQAGRLEEVIALPLPNAAARRTFLLSRGISSDALPLPSLLSASEGWTFAELQALLARTLLELQDDNKKDTCCSLDSHLFAEKASEILHRIQRSELASEKS